MAIPEGVTAYTMVIDGPNTWIWNAMRGEKYSVNDIFCPLVSIGCLINHENVHSSLIERKSKSYTHLICLWSGLISMYVLI